MDVWSRNGDPGRDFTLRLALASDANGIVVDLRGLELLDSTGLIDSLPFRAPE